MKYNKKREEISALIDNLKTHFDRLSKEEIPMLELSVILSKTNRLAEKIAILKHELSTDQSAGFWGSEDFASEMDDLPSIEHKESKLTSTKRTVIADQEIKIQKDNIAEGQVQADKKLIETPIEESQGVDTTKEESQTSQPENIKESLSVEEVIEETSIQTDASLPDLNEQYNEEDDPSLSDQLKRQPINDLLTAIGLNERYLYANELFEGNMEEFKKVINELNTRENLESAQSYIDNNLLISYKWDKNNEVVKALLLLVERRYL